MKINGIITDSLRAQSPVSVEVYIIIMSICIYVCDVGNNLNNCY